MTLQILLIWALLLLLLDGNLGGLKSSEILNANTCPAGVWFSFLQDSHIVQRGPPNLQEPGSEFLFFWLTE